MSRFSELIDAVADQKNHTLSDVLLKAKVLAYSLKSRKFRHWINAEISGYAQEEQLPEYRIVSANIEGIYGGYGGAYQDHVPISVAPSAPTHLRETFRKEHLAKKRCQNEADIAISRQNPTCRGHSDTVSKT